MLYSYLYVAATPPTGRCCWWGGGCVRTCLYAQSKLLSLVPFFGHFCTVFISLIHPELCEPATLSLNTLQSWEQVHKSALLCRTQKDGGKEEEVGVSTAFKPYSDSVSLRVKFTQNFTILKWSSNIEIGQCSQLTDPSPLHTPLVSTPPFSAVYNRATLLTVLGKGQHSFVVD